jgi:hypothetical protein
MPTYLGNLVLLIYGIFGAGSAPPETYFRITDDAIPDIRETDSGDLRITD